MPDPNQSEQIPPENPDGLFAQFERENPERAHLLRAEIEQIADGRFVPVAFDLDPLTAQQFAGALDLAMSHPAFPQSPREALTQIFEGIVERLAPQFPELARQLVIGRAQRAENSAPQPHSPAVSKHLDTVRMDWLHNAFLGADMDAGHAIGLPGRWNDLRAAVDAAIEEGR